MPVYQPAAAGERLPPRPRRRRALRQDASRGRRRSSSTRRTTRPAASPPRTTCEAIADLVRGTNIAVFSDEPYCHMVWAGQAPHAAGRAGHAGAVRRRVHVQQVVQHERLAARLRRDQRRASPTLIGKMINTSLSCVPPIVQLAGKAALEHDAAERDEAMRKFHEEGRAAGRRAAEGGRA